MVRSSPRLAPQPRAAAPSAGMRWDPFSGTYVSAVIEKPRRRGRVAQAPSEPMTSEVRRSGRSCPREGPDNDATTSPSPALKMTVPAQGASGSTPVGHRGDRAKDPRWIGRPTSLGASGERFYQGVIVDDEHFHAGDDVALAIGAGGNEVYVGRIISLWETPSGDGEMELKWYYAPEDTSSGRLAGHDPREIFESVHTDENPVGAIDRHVRVLGWDQYQRWLDAPVEEDDEEEQDTYVCRAQYHPGTGEFMPLNGASSLSEAARRGGLAACSARLGPSHASASSRGDPPPPRGSGGRRLSRFSEAARVLTPHAAPTRLPCREKEREEVTSALRAAIAAGGQATSLYISGTPGTGKTATVHHAIRTLAADGSLPPFRTLEVNGMKLSAPQQVYSLLWEGLTGQHVPSQRAAALLEKRFSAIEKRRKGAQEVVVLLLDELDYLVTRTQSVIYNLFEWASSAHAPLVVVGISNTMDLPERLLPRVHSRLGIRRVNFLPYSHSEIESIICDRLRDLDAFEPKAVELCARKVAAVSGDVRRALEVCRLAAQLAEREELDAAPSGRGPLPHPAPASPPSHVGIELIERASRQLRGSASLRAIAALPKQQLLLLCCAVLQQRKTGLAEVALDRLTAHHAALSRRHGAVGLASPAELQQMLARLKDGRLMGLAGAPGMLRLLVQPEDVKQAAKQQGGFLAELPWEN